MSVAEDLKDSLESFAQSCNENERLMTMIKDWNRTILIHATDIDHYHTVVTNSGTVTYFPAKQPAVDLTVQSTAEILAQVFYGEVSPNEPYNAGTLRINGPQDDIVRLDFVIAMIWE
jgi:putative sterol carrier protein